MVRSAFARFSTDRVRGVMTYLEVSSTKNLVSWPSASSGSSCLPSVTYHTTGAAPSHRVVLGPHGLPGSIDLFTFLTALTLKDWPRKETRGSFLPLWAKKAVGELASPGLPPPLQTPRPLNMVG